MYFVFGVILLFCLFVFIHAYNKHYFEFINDQYI